MNALAAQRIEVSPEHSDSVVRTMLRHADILPRESYSTVEALELLAACDYAVDRSVLEEFRAKGYFTPPATDCWTAGDIHQLAVALSMRRRWKPRSKLHDSRKSAARLQRENGGEAEMRAEAEKFTAEDLVLMLVKTDDRLVREVIYESLLLRFDHDGVQL